MNKVFASFVFATFMLIAGCKKSDKLPTGDFPDLNTRVNASASGFVTNEQNQPVQGAIVKMGMMSTTTNLFGYFEFNDVEVVKNAAIIKVETPGYFTAIKTHSVIAGENYFTRIKLIPKNTLGIIDAITGGSVTDANGFKIQIQPNSVVYDVSGLPYNGAITVFGNWLNPLNDDLPLTMPGDLRALNSNGYLQTLITYGMVAVELKGSNGEALQIVAGKTSTVTFPVPSPLNHNAPSTIPLWYFDEGNGHWVEEGVANRVGDFYVGDVSHFSFWNCDIPENTVKFSIIIKSNQGMPHPYYTVVFRSATSPNQKRTYFTNSEGFASGLLPKYTDMIMEVRSSPLCNTVIYSQQLTTSGSDIDFGELTLPDNLMYGSISGTLVNCSSQPVVNGAVLVIMSGGFQALTHTDNNGQFNINAPLCSANEQAVIIAFDYSSNIQSSPNSIQVDENGIALGQIEICNESTNLNQFLRYTIHGTTYEYTSTNSNITIWNQGINQKATIIANENFGSRSAELTYDYSNLGSVDSTRLLKFVNSDNPAGNIFSQDNALIYVTEYGNIGEFFSGAFSVFKVDADGNPVSIVGQFKVRRTF